MSEEKLNGYTLDAPFTNANAGFSRWTFAHKGKEEYFLKELLNPVYPISDKLQERTKALKTAECRKFEKKQIRLIEAINKGSLGNVVRIEEFFRCDSHYYLATKRIRESGIDHESLKEYPFEDRVFLCATLAYTAYQMHSNHFVHGDIKDSNILLKKTEGGKLIAKIIDFDGGFLEDEPPQFEDELTGDQVYFAPEACEFLYGEPVRLTSKIDVFAFGLLFHRYLAGNLPGFDTEKYRYTHEAVLDDQQLQISSDLPEDIRTVLENMLIRNPEERAEMKDAVTVFRQHLPFFPCEETDDRPLEKTSKLRIIPDYLLSDKSSESGSAVWFSEPDDL